MLTQKTVLVVGAGASFDFGLPTGVKLKQKIRERLNSHFLAEQFGNDPDYIRSADLYKYAANVIQTALGGHQSIDNLLNSLGTDPDIGGKLVLVGKRAIADCILAAESLSPLVIQSPHHPHAFGDEDAVERSWLGHLARILAENVSARGPHRVFENLVIINFNYDRCIEQFFRHMLCRQFPITQERADEICAEHLKIFHVYGSLGSLTTDPASRTNFGDFTPSASKRAAAQIRTFMEEFKSPELVDIKLHLSQAQRIICLGFAFHQQNMRLIAPAGLRQHAALFGTAFEQSPFDVTEYKRRVYSFWNAGAQMHCVMEKEWHCTNLFENFAATWSGE